MCCTRLHPRAHSKNALKKWNLSRRSAKKQKNRPRPCRWVRMFGRQCARHGGLGIRVWLTPESSDMPVAWLRSCVWIMHEPTPAPLSVSILQSELENVNLFRRKEQRLMMSAFYHMGTDLCNGFGKVCSQHECTHHQNIRVFMNALTTKTCVFFMNALTNRASVFSWAPHIPHPLQFGARSHRVQGALALHRSLGSGDGVPDCVRRHTDADTAHSNTLISTYIWCIPLIVQ